MARIAPSLESVRNPEYVGENRCIPCTAVNVAIALGASALLAVASIELAAVVFALSILVVAVRGYLVPGTPTLTERYLPDRILARFDHSTRETGRTDADSPSWETLEKVEYERRNAVDPDRFLVDAGVVAPRESGDGDESEDGDERRFTDAFADRLERNLDEIRPGPPDRELLAATFETEPDEVTVEDRDHPAISVESRVRRWPSESALLADVATDESLRESTDRWTDVPLEQRLDVLESLRSVRETCPACGGELGMSAETVESCCRAPAHEVVTLVCLDCEQPLRELAPSADSSTPPRSGRSSDG